MNKKPSIIITLAMVTLALFAFAQTAQSQEGTALINQLTSNESASMNEAQLTEAYQQAIDYLVPLMSESSRNQYSIYLALQNLGSHASRPGAEVERLHRAFIRRHDV